MYTEQDVRTAAMPPWTLPPMPRHDAEVLFLRDEDTVIPMRQSLSESRHTVWQEHMRPTVDLR